MKFQEYAEKAVIIRSYPSWTQEVKIQIGVNGLCEEIGEVVLATENLEKKMPVDREPGDLCLELGDVMWYVTHLSHTLGDTLPHVASEKTYENVSLYEREIVHRSPRTSLDFQWKWLVIQGAKISGLQKKAVRSGTLLSKEQILLPLRDIVRSVTLIGNAYLVKLDTILEVNISKIYARFPDGTWTAELAAEKRDEKK